MAGGQLLADLGVLDWAKVAPDVRARAEAERGPVSTEPAWHGLHGSEYAIAEVGNRVLALAVALLLGTFRAAQVPWLWFGPLRPDQQQAVLGRTPDAVTPAAKLTSGPQWMVDAGFYAVETDARTIKAKNGAVDQWKQLTRHGEWDGRETKPHARAALGLRAAIIGHGIDAANAVRGVNGVDLVDLAAFVTAGSETILDPVIGDTIAKLVAAFNDSRDNDGNNPLGNEQLASALEYADYDSKLVMGTGWHNKVHGSHVFPDTLRWMFGTAPPPNEFASFLGAGAKL